MDEKFGKNGWLFNKRFALHQGTPENPKVRVIDDCKRSGLNSAYTTTNKLELLDVDVLACALMAIADAHFTGWVDLGENETGRLAGPMHVVAKTLTWQGRTLDLSKAYKQVPLNAEAQAMCVLGYYHQGEWKYYTTSRLPFGATSAVYTFNRISRSITPHTMHFLHIVCTCSTMTFPALSTTFGAALVSKSMSMVLDLLGWGTCADWCQGHRLRKRVFSLGDNLLSCRSCTWVSLRWRTKKGGFPKIIQMLTKIKQQGRITPHEAAEVQGHLILPRVSSTPSP